MAANWKMNKTIEEASSFIETFKGLVKDSKVEIVIAPPFTTLSQLKKITETTNIQVAAQNMHYEDNGAFTGEISPLMLKNLAEYVILGHSERRQYFNEDNNIINKKIKAALSNNLKVILCVGESLEERESNKTNSIITNQIKNCLNKIDAIKNIVIAYEPIWAIGTGKTATPEQAEEVHKFIRELLSNIYDENSSQVTRILYGGSVKPSNIKELMEKENIDGALVGGASLSPESFAELCN